MNIVKVPLSSVLPWEKNPRGIKRADFERLKKQILELGVYKPLVCYRDGDNYVVLGGNMRIRALKDIGVKEVEVSVVKPKTEADKIKYALSDNDRAGFYEEDKLAELVYPEIANLDLGEFKVDLRDSVSLKSAVEQFGPDTHGNAGDLLSSKEEELSGMGMVYDLRQDVRFDGSPPYDLPLIRSDMIYDGPVPRSWAGPLATLNQEKTEAFLYNYGTDSTVGLDFSKTLVSFYTDDARFEKLWENTKEVAVRFLNRKILGMVSPNFSTYYKWPKAMRIYNVFRSRWVARYMQEAGIPVIPDITGDKSDLDFLFSGIPTGCSLCLQVHRALGSDEDKENKNAVIEAAYREIKPSQMWVYGTTDKVEAYSALRSRKGKFELIIPRQVLHHERKATLSKSKKEA